MDYVTRFNEDGSDLVFSTYLGSPYPAQGNETYLTEVCIDNTGRVIAGGRTRVSLTGRQQRTPFRIR